MKVFELFESGDVLLEKLGNLANLKVGSMINILKQTVRSYSGRRRHGMEATPTGNSFGGEKSQFTDHGGFGDTSEIVDAGIIKGGIGGLRKAYRAHDSPIAFALYVDGKAVCFGKFDEHDLGGTSRASVFAYDLSQFKDQIEKQGQEKYDKDDTWSKRNRKPEDYQRKSSSYSEKDPDSWETRNNPKVKNKVYHGELTSTAALKTFLEELIGYAGDKPITCKLVLKDKVGSTKHSDRWTARMTDDQLESGLEGLKKRLITYKISKKPSVDNIEDFLKQALEGKNKIVQFAGRGWSTKAENPYDKLDALSVLNGRPFSINYKCVDAGSYDSLDVYYSFDKATGTLAPYKAKWTGKDKEGHSETAEASLKHDVYIKNELGADASDKDSVVKAVLTKMKDGNTYAAKKAIAAARRAGHDYPEFKVIEKSIAATTEAEKN